MTVKLYRGDCREVMDLLLPDSCVDAIVTDPPYGLTQARPSGRSEATRGAVMGGFMGLAWDRGVPGAEYWREALRVAKPGAHLLAFGGTRTFHRLACAIEDAGWELRDTIMWVYGSGFPKSKSALKPAWEPIIVARKHLEGAVAENTRKHGAGAVNINGCRVAAETGLGRWPANVIHDGSDEVLSAFPDAPGQLVDASSSSSSRKTQHVYGAMKRGNGREGQPSANSDNGGVVGFKVKPGARRGDTGSAARFFYCAKASKTDREEGCEHLAAKPGGMLSNTSGQHITRRDGGASGPRRNNHPTVKPTKLMRYLCRLVTPSGGVVLDPFMGSGSTGKAAVLEGFNFIGVELEAPYIEIARARIGAAA